MGKHYKVIQHSAQGALESAHGVQISLHLLALRPWASSPSIAASSGWPSTNGKPAVSHREHPQCHGACGYDCVLSLLSGPVSMQPFGISSRHEGSAEVQT